MKIMLSAIGSGVFIMILSSCMKPDTFTGKFTDQASTYEFLEDGSVLYYKNTKPQSREKGTFRHLGSTLALSMDDGHDYALLVAREGRTLIYSDGGRGDTFERVTSEN